MEKEPLKRLRRRLIAEAEFPLLLDIARQLGAEVYLVGGLLRDAWWGRETYDADFVFSRRSLEAAARFAQTTGGTLVLLREVGGMARVVLKQRIFDFAEFRGPDLLADLTDRDFTINAVALPLAGAFTDGPWEPVDPHQGLKDIEEKTLRMVSEWSFPQDPLRLLRAFRLCAQGDLRPEPQTVEAIKEHKHLLLHCAAERIHQEWRNFLSQRETFPHLRQMDDCGLLSVLFPELAALKGLDQDRHHHLDAFEHTLLTYRILEDFIRGKDLLPAHLAEDLGDVFHPAKKAAPLKWAALMHDLGKARTRVKDEGGRLSFHGHARASADQFRAVADRLRIGNQERDFLLSLVEHHMRPLYLAHEESRGTLTPRALLRLLREMKGEISPLFLLALADDLAAQGPEKPPFQGKHLQSVWGKALSLRNDVLRPLETNPPLINGNDLIAFGLKPGPIFGRLLAELKEERLEGRVRTREDALIWLRKRLADPSFSF